MILVKNYWDWKAGNQVLRSFEPNYPAKLLLDIIITSKLRVNGKFTVIDENQIQQRHIHL